MRPAVFIPALLALLCVSLILPGCLQKLNGGSSLFEQDYRNNLSRVAIFNSSMAEFCKPGSCWCMVCKNGTNIFGPLTNLIGGYCYYDKNCTPEQLAKYDNYNNTGDPSLSVRPFMIGQGPTFGDFGAANTQCSDRLNMAVMWLVGDNVTPYLRPDAMRAMCFLSKDIIPVYIFYSNGTNINISRTASISEIWGTEGDDLFLGRLSSGPVGPVIAVTEMDFDKSRAGEVAAQVRAIDSGCRNDRANNKINCFIAVAPKINDFEALDAVMNALSADRDKVDLVAYGINGRYMHTCDAGNVRLQAKNFSMYALYNWSKPTIIPYVLFDPGTSDVDNSCNWTESDVVSAYGAFFPFGVTTLKQRGVIGIAAYSFNTSGGIGVTNPLNCTDCGVGRTTSRLRAWYGGCQAFTNNSRPGASNPSPQQIVFGNESGTACNSNLNMDYMRGFSFAGRDIMQQQTVELRAAAPLLFTCDACLLANASRPVSDIFPSLRPSSGVPPERYCTAFPEINQWASARNLDPMLVRAFVLTESGFDPCSAARVCRQGYDDGRCFEPGPGKDECYDKAYDEMYDLPNGNCTFDIAPNSGSSAPDWRYCAVGLMQSLEPPYTFWPAAMNPDGADGPYFDVFNRSGFHTISLVGAKGCNPRFNPFVPADSICMGTLKMEGALRDARAWISSNRGKLNWGAGDIDKDSLFAAYIAGNMYAGFWGSTARAADHPRCSSGVSNGDCWAYGFSLSWAVNDTYCSSSEGQDDPHCEGGHPKKNPPYECYGYTDFIQYVQECEVPFLPRRADPGKNKVEAFIYLSNGCPNNFCPDGKRLFQLMDRTLPLSGTPYIPDLPQCATTSTTGGGGLSLGG
ncbi:hypothetical protein L0Y65_05910 [Candidatus Micrarchaeota archaeon]|nr:hypothetical protein [Candidatus Micrarchaeota archaeon]